MSKFDWDKYEDVEVAPAKEEVRAKAAEPTPEPSSSQSFDWDKYDDDTRSVAPASESNPNEISKLETLHKAAAQGILFDHADELSAAAGTLGAKLGGDERPWGEVYDGIIPEVRNEFKAAAEANPKTNIIGNIGGGMLGGSTWLKLARNLGLAKNAKDAKTAYDAMGRIERIKTAGKAGMGVGAVAGLGASEANLHHDVSMDDVTEAAKDTMIGTAIGGAAGLGTSTIYQGVGAAKDAFVRHGKKVGDLGALHDMKEALKRGYQTGEDLRGQQARLKAESQALSVIEELEEIVGDVRGKVGKLKEGVIAEGERDGHVIDLTKRLKSALEQAQKLPENSPEEVSQKKKIVEFILKRLEGDEVEKEVVANFKKIKPGKTVTIPAQKGAREALEEEATKATEAARQLGQTLRTEIVESTDENGKKLLTLVKHIDEPIESAEKLTAPMDIGIEETPFSKVKASFEASPKGREKAEAKLAHLTSKAKTEGTGSTYTIEADPEHGVIKVVETGTKVKNVKIPGEPQLETGPQFKSTAKAKTVFDEPSIPEQTQQLPNEVQHGQLNKTVKVREGGKAVTNVKDADEFKQSAQDFAFEENFKGAARGKAERIVKDLAKGVKEEVEAPFENMPQIHEGEFSWRKGMVPGQEPTLRTHNPLRDINQRYSSAIGAEEALPNLRTIQQMSAETQGSVSARATTKAFGTSLKDAAKALPMEDRARVDAVLKKMQDKATKLDLTKKISSDKAVGNGNFMGTVRGFAIAKANTVGLLGREIAQGTPEDIKAFGKLIGSAFGKTGSELSNVFNELSTKDQKGRNAMIFALSQNPEYRKIMESLGSMATPDFIEEAISPEEKN